MEHNFKIEKFSFIKGKVFKARFSVCFYDTITIHGIKLCYRRENGFFLLYPIETYKDGFGHTIERKTVNLDEGLREALFNKAVEVYTFLKENKNLGEEKEEG